MIDSSVPPYYSGTSGLVLAVPKYSFPTEHKDKSRLGYYSTLFNSIEINSSFYKVPMASTIQKWAADVPDGFRFTFKLFKGITHNKGLAYDPDDIEHFMETIDNVGNKKGCLLVQFPASITIDHKEVLEELLGYIRSADPKGQWKIAVEFRHKSLYQQSIYNALKRFGMDIVFHDIAASTPPLIDLATTFAYLRYHGPAGDYRGTYPDEFLKIQAERISRFITIGKTVFVYFNNTAGDAYNNLVSLNRLLLNYQ